MGVRFQSVTSFCKLKIFGFLDYCLSAYFCRLVSAEITFSVSSNGPCKVSNGAGSFLPGFFGFLCITIVIFFPMNQVFFNLKPSRSRATVLSIDLLVKDTASFCNIEYTRRALFLPNVHSSWYYSFWVT